MKRACHTYTFLFLIASFFSCGEQPDSPSFNQISEQYLKSSPDSVIYYADLNLANEADKAHYSHYLKGYAYTAKKDYKKALTSYLDGINLISDQEEYFKDKFEMLNNVGRICKIHNNFQKAEEYYQDAMKYVPYNDKAGLLYNLGIVYQAKKEYDKATEVYFRALEIATKNNDFKRPVKIYNQIGLIFKALGDYDEAISHFQTIINYEGNKTASYLKYKAKAVHNIGNTYMASSEYEKAVPFLLKAVDLRQKESEKFISFKDLGTCYTQLKNYPLAKVYYNKAKALYPLVDPVMKNIELFKLMEVAYYESKAFDKSHEVTETYHNEISQFIATKEVLLQKITAAEIKHHIDQFNQQNAFVVSLIKYKYVIGFLAFLLLAIAVYAIKKYRQTNLDRKLVASLLSDSKTLS